MTTDLTPQKDKPLWPLSVYAPAKGEPSLLTELDESPEELRIKAHLALKNGSMNEYVGDGLFNHISTNSLCRSS